MTNLQLYIAIVLGIAAAWPALFLHERVLKVMAALRHRQQRAVGLSRYLLLRSTYWLLGILWMTAATIVFMGLSLIYFHRRAS